MHGVGGVLGTICLGTFASRIVNPKGADGLLFGGGAFFGRQTLAVLAAAAYAFVFTYVMLWVINKITPVKVTQEQEERGLDEALHGETAYL